MRTLRRKKRWRKRKRARRRRSELQCGLSVAMQQSCTHGPRQLFLSNKQGRDKEVEEKKEEEKELEGKEEEKEEITTTMLSSAAMQQGYTRDQGNCFFQVNEEEKE